jgi:hypothetical protein
MQLRERHQAEGISARVVAQAELTCGVFTGAINVIVR